MAIGSGQINEAVQGVNKLTQETLEHIRNLSAGVDQFKVGEESAEGA